MAGCSTKGLARRALILERTPPTGLGRSSTQTVKQQSSAAVTTGGIRSISSTPRPCTCSTVFVAPPHFLGPCQRLDHLCSLLLLRAPCPCMRSLLGSVDAYNIEPFQTNQETTSRWPAPGLLTRAGRRRELATSRVSTLSSLVDNVRCLSSRNSTVAVAFDSLSDARAGALCSHKADNIARLWQSKRASLPDIRPNRSMQDNK